MVHGLLALLVGITGLAVGLQPEGRPAAEPAVAPDQVPNRFPDGRALLIALGERDGEIETLTGGVRLTGIQVLQGDTQQRSGKLAMRTEFADGDGGEKAEPRRMFSVHFDSLRLDRRVDAIDEEYIFDGRWLVERLPGEKQFIKREIVPAGQTLDPMELMRDAPFWISVGDDADRVLRDYHAEVLEPTAGLTEDAEAPELASLAPLVAGTVQLRLTPREGAAAQDDWESVRMWFTPDTLLPRLYVKTSWTGDLQIAELFGVAVNGEVDAARFDTTAPEPRSGWQVQISAWRGQP